MVFRRSHRTTWYVQVPTRTGWVQRSTETRDRLTAKAMEDMLQRLGPRGRREWDLLDAIEANRLTVAQVYDAYRMEGLDELRTSLNDVDLEPHVDAWGRWLADRVHPETAERYLVHLRAFVPEKEPSLRSRFQKDRIAVALAELPVSGSTKRKYFAAVSSFGDYLTEVGVLSRNLVRDVKPPPAPDPVPVEVDLAEVLQVVEGAREPYKAVLALLYGAGVEISAALALRSRHVDVERHEVRAPGTKTYNRDRVVIVADWAWPHFAKALAGKLPSAPLFPALDRWRVGKYHKALLRDLELPHHKLHAARHFWTIRAIKAGWPIEAVSRQLGHKDAVMVLRVYGRFVPRYAERRRWEDEATAQDQTAIRKAAGAPRGAIGRRTGTLNEGD